MMKRAWVGAGGLLLAATTVLAQADLQLPKTVEAGAPFSIDTAGSGKGTLYIVGPAQALHKDVELGQKAEIGAGELHNAGHYMVIVAGSGAAQQGELDVVAAKQPEHVSFLAKPSRLAVSLHDGITGAVYVFDAYENLITRPLPVSFQLSVTSGPTQARTVQTKDGYAWTGMDSASREGQAQFVAKVGDVTSTRVIQQVPGDPCGLRMSAKPAAGQKIDLVTDPVRDCSGNPVPDGTIVTFTETYGKTQSTVDVPLKRGIAQAEVPAYNGAKLSAATGVVMGNEIRWDR